VAADCRSRRTRLRARRLRAGAGAQSHGGPASGARPILLVHFPRHRHGGLSQPPRGGHVLGRDRRGRASPRGAQAAAPPLYSPPARSRAGRASPPKDLSSRGHARRGAQPQRCGRRLPIRAALPDGPGPMPGGEAASASSRGRQAGGLPFRRRHTRLAERNNLMTEFTLRFGQYRLAGYRSGAGGVPLMIVHGGPGVPCSYVYGAHKHYASEGFDVVSWDQLGCGRSDRPNDPSLWVVERFVEEVEAVREQLGWDKFLLLGNSWGGMLGIEYCLAHLDRVRAFVIGNSAASMPRLIRGFDRCKQGLGSDTARMMSLREAEGTVDHPEYLAARTILMYRHMCRLDHWPDPLLESMR